MCLLICTFVAHCILMSLIRPTFAQPYKLSKCFCYIFAIIKLANTYVCPYIYLYAKKLISVVVGKQTNNNTTRFFSKLKDECFERFRP